MCRFLLVLLIPGVLASVLGIVLVLVVCEYFGELTVCFCCTPSLSLHWNLPIINGQPIGNGAPILQYELQQMQWSVDKYAKTTETLEEVRQWVTLEQALAPRTEKDGVQPL